LARAPAFALGALRVDPARREVAGPAGADVLEPRVMQVLVALTRAHGAIVTRDELTMSCWDGRVVGDDAINRVIGRLRRLAQRTAAFELETIRKVGYRLVPAAAPRPAADEQPIGAALPIASAYLAFPVYRDRPAPRSTAAAAAAPGRGGRALRHAAFMALLALGGTGASQAPQMFAEAPVVTPAVLAQADALRQQGGQSGGVTVRIRGHLRHLGVEQSFPEETLTYRPFPPDSLSRAPDSLLDWLTPSAATAEPPPAPELDEI
jgi:DNA-binding winged helix-turn-helix (wHTH) protein